MYFCSPFISLPLPPSAIRTRKRSLTCGNPVTQMRYRLRYAIHGYGCRISCIAMYLSSAIQNPGRWPAKTSRFRVCIACIAEVERTREALGCEEVTQ